MKIKRFAFTLVAAAALAGLGTSSASAAVQTVAAQWYTGAGATTLPLGSSKTLKATVATHPVIGAKFTFHTVIAGMNVDMTATGVECVSCKIENRAVNGTKAAEPTTTEKANVIAWGTGKLKFTGVTVDVPANCIVKSSEAGTTGIVETKELVTHADWMDTVETNKKAFIDFIPKTGPTTVFLQFFIDGTGCAAIQGSYNVLGVLVGESANNTGVAATTQNVQFSSAIQATGGAGLGTFEITGTGAFSLSTGESFQVK